MGTTVHQMPPVQNRMNGGSNGVGVVEGSRQTVYHDGSQANGEYPTSQQDEDVAGSIIARHGGHPLFAGQANFGNESGGPYDRDDQGSVSEAALLAHQQEQRGVSHLSNAVSAVATNGASGRHTLAQVSPDGAPTTLVQGVTGLSNAALNSGAHIGIEKRGPVEFNHAIGYVNKIKVSIRNLGQHSSGRMTLLTNIRIASQTNLKSTNNSWKFCKHINESQSLSKTCMRKSHNFSILLRIY